MKAEQIRLRPYCDEDIKRMERWLFLPHVARWYQHPEHWLRELRERKCEFSFLTHFIAEADRKPIGFCQYYDTFFAQEHEVWNEERNIGEQKGGIYSIDYLIGEPEYLRRGFGSQMIRKMIEKVWQAGAKKIIVEPEKDNTASNCVLESSGFMRRDRNYVLERPKEKEFVNGK